MQTTTRWHQKMPWHGFILIGAGALGMWLCYKIFLLLLRWQPDSDANYIAVIGVFAFAIMGMRGAALLTVFCDKLAVKRSQGPTDLQ
ncbi:MAG: hypothetical protein Q7S48_04380 [bacterium]|nr:hypothetical protein [bacterium]